MDNTSHFFMSQIANSLSLWVVIYFLTPFGVFVFTRNFQHLTWGVAVLSTPVLAELIKKLSVHMEWGSWCKRPQGARDCDTWNHNGSQEGAPGFPSGHTATTAAFWMGAFLLLPTYKIAIAIVGSLGVLLMAWARLNKRCHTLLQTIGGAVLGAGTTYTLLRHR